MQPTGLLIAAAPWPIDPRDRFHQARQQGKWLKARAEDARLPTQRCAALHGDGRVAAAARLEAQGRRIIHLEVGQPAAAAPSSAPCRGPLGVDARSTGLYRGVGSTSLRARIAKFYQQRYGLAETRAASLSPPVPPRDSCSASWRYLRPLTGRGHPAGVSALSAYFARARMCAR